MLETFISRAFKTLDHRKTLGNAIDLQRSTHSDVPHDEEGRGVADKVLIAMPITPLQRFWYLLMLLGWKDRVFEVLKPHGVTSFKFLSMQKQEEVVDYLQTEWNTRSKRPRGAVIHYLCIMPGYDFKNILGEPNYEKIDEWVNSKMGKPLNKLSLQELNKTVTMVKQWYNKQLKQ
jgi:hypothetical protein